MNNTTTIKEIILSGNHDPIFVLVTAPIDASDAELETLALKEVTAKTEIHSSSFDGSCHNVVLSGDHSDIFVLVPGPLEMDEETLLEKAIDEAFAYSYIKQ